MIIDELKLDDLIPVFNENDLGYETHPVFPRVMKSSWRYQDIYSYEYELQYMFNGRLTTHSIRTRKELEEHLAAIKERFGG